MSLEILQMSQLLDKIVGLTERREIIWNKEGLCYKARKNCRMHVVKITMDLHPFSTAEKRIARFLVSYPNLLESNFNNTGPFFDSSGKLVDAIEKQINKKLEW